MKYSALIRKLIKASEEAKWQNSDVADRLKERCVYGIDIIRQTLMNSVCDPRFRMHIGAVPGWKELAKKKLEDFASKLQSINGLTEEIAMMEMDNMLAYWFQEVMTIAERADREMSFASYDRRDPRERMKKAIDDYVNGKPIENEDKDEEIQLLDWSGEETKDALGYADEDEEAEENPRLGTKSNDSKDKGEDKDNEDENQENEEENDAEEFSNPFGSGVKGYGIGRGRGTEQEIEDRFFANVPPSLIELAKRIGRSAEFEGEPTGSFMSASKSDIAGITTGNDLSCILPSELALMASPATENIFYKNYVTRNLQLFASVSHSSKSKHHHDGPIIICLDTSGSMLGEPMTVAKALTFAVCIIAQRKKRKVIVIKYSDSHTPFFLRNISSERKELLEFLKNGEVGGNNEDELFRWLFSELLPTQGDYQYGDVLCVSDFGWAPISKDTMELINKEKEKNMKFYGLNIGDNEHGFLSYFSSMEDNSEESEWFSPVKVCDSLWEYNNGVCKEVSDKEGK